MDDVMEIIEAIEAMDDEDRRSFMEEFANRYIACHKNGPDIHTKVEHGVIYIHEGLHAKTYRRENHDA